MKTQTLKQIIKSNFGLLAIAVLIGLTHQQCSSSKASEQKNNVAEKIPVKIASEQIHEMVKSLDLTGIVIASKEQRLSFKTGGIIDQIYVSEGQNVKKGQLLATLKLNEIEAQVNQANLGLDKAKRDYKRVSNLYADSVVTLEQMQNVTTALEMAKSNVEIAEYNLEYSTIKSPSDGRVLMKLNESNELVATGTPILVIVSSEKEWQVSTGVSDKEIVRISLFDKASISIDAYNDKEFSAEVCQIGDAPDPMTGMYEVKLALHEVEEELKPGFFTSIKITPHKKQKYLTIPVNSVTEGVGNTVTYYTLSSDKTKAVKKTAQVEWIQNNVVVLSTNIRETEPVVVASQKELNHLALVNVIE